MIATDMYRCQVYVWNLVPGNESEQQFKYLLDNKGLSIHLDNKVFCLAIE